jgi:hypothetical protein
MSYERAEAAAESGGEMGICRLVGVLCGSDYIGESVLLWTMMTATIIP